MKGEQASATGSSECVLQLEQLGLCEQNESAPSWVREAACGLHWDGGWAYRMCSDVLQACWWPGLGRARGSARSSTAAERRQACAVPATKALGGHHPDLQKGLALSSLF